jgi:hypothetical protein
MPYSATVQKKKPVENPTTPQSQRTVGIEQEKTVDSLPESKSKETMSSPVHPSSVSPTSSIELSKTADTPRAEKRIEHKTKNSKLDWVRILYGKWKRTMSRAKPLHAASIC